MTEATLERKRTGVINEGKTKIIYSTNDPSLVEIFSKDDITAGNGKKHDVLTDKGKWSTTTTCNIFELLKKCGVPVAFQERIGPECFVANSCEMISLEVICRREAHGSCLYRNPHISKGHYFPKLICELFLKTSGQKWSGYDLPCDDPLIVFKRDVAQLFEPDKPLWVQKPFLEIPSDEFHAKVANAYELIEIEKQARHVFLVLEKAWQLQGQTLVDFKIEFGRHAGQILLADVIDSDSWRKLGSDGQYADKQLYRDNAELAKVAEKFREAAELTGQFRIPRQQIIVWTGSKNDDIKPLTEELHNFIADTSIKFTSIVCSMHKEPVTGFHTLNKAIQEIPDSVVISLIGMSNGAGPTIAANCTVPVITVPATAKEFPDDVWSSLRDPSNVPVATILNPKNAALYALQILAKNNPALYANLRYEQEKRLPNIFIIGLD